MEARRLRRWDSQVRDSGIVGTVGKWDSQVRDSGIVGTVGKRDSQIRESGAVGRWDSGTARSGIV